MGVRNTKQEKRGATERNRNKAPRNGKQAKDKKKNDNKTVQNHKQMSQTSKEKLVSKTPMARKKCEQ